ncbi:hypothetical protein ACA910_003407 [Epithemia clementina (nom. ined.)]
MQRRFCAHTKKLHRDLVGRFCVHTKKLYRDLVGCNVVIAVGVVFLELAAALAELSFSPTRRSTTNSSSVQALERVRQGENNCNRLYKRIAELEKMLSDEKSLVERLEKQTVEDMTIEKKQIFDKVRLQVTKPFLDRDRCLAPSAPPEPGQDNENEGALYAPPISQRTGSELAPPIQVPTTKDSHYMHRLHFLSDRLKQENQSIQALQRALERARQQLPDLTTKKNEYNNTTVKANQGPTAIITDRITTVLSLGRYSS